MDKERDGVLVDLSMVEISRLRSMRRRGLLDDKGHE
jgi:hypothetical protein